MSYIFRCTSYVHSYKQYLSGPKYPEPFAELWNLFRMMCDREKANGIPPCKGQSNTKHLQHMENLGRNKNP